MTRHELFAKGLVTTHGEKDALRIADNALRVSRNGATLTMFEEADFVVSDYGKYEFAKIQTKEPLTVKNKRIKANINFWSLIVQTLTKGQKNASSTTKN